MATRPIQKWRISNMECAVWENTKKLDNGTEVSYRTISLIRSFKKKDEDIWRSEVINSIRRNDIAKIQAILSKAQDYLFFEARKEEEKEDESE